MQQKILVIDDELSIRRFLRIGLEAAGYRVVEADEGGSGLAKAVAERPDLIILDLMLPDIYGLEVLSRLREWSRSPIIVLSVQGGEDDKISALDGGADDYLTKPFSMGELLARMRTALRHAATSPGGEPVFQARGLIVDLGRRTVQRKDQAIHLSATEYEMLVVFIRHAGRVLTHRQVLSEMGHEGDLESGVKYLRVFINQLRKKIEANPAHPELLITEPGVGYRLLDQ